MRFQTTRHRARIFVAWACCSAALVAPWSHLEAQETEQDAELETGWSNTTDFGLAVTDGNSATETLKVHNLLRWRSERASFRLKLDGLRSDTADDRFRKVDPGFSWEPAAPPPPEVTSSLVDPDREPDVERYFAEARYERSMSKKPRLLPGSLSWHAGASWERNEDAGLLGRTVAFAGVGHSWWDREDLKFRTSYSLSWTDRNEEASDPEKEERFLGLRFDWLYENRWGKHVTYVNDWTFNAELDDFSDYSSSMTNSLSVPLSQRLSLKVSLQWLYNSVPSIEDIDVVAEVMLVDPDGIPGNGDELFETVESGGLEIELGSVQERRKERLDTIFTTSLSIEL